VGATRRVVRGDLGRSGGLQHECGYSNFSRMPLGIRSKCGPCPAIYFRRCQDAALKRK
jgi:hypothetical protein